MSINKYALWESLHGDRHENGDGVVSYEDLEELRVLFEHANGWIWTGSGRGYTPQIVTFAQWQAVFAQPSKLADQASLTQREWTDLEWPGGNQ